MENKIFREALEIPKPLYIEETKLEEGVVHIYLNFDRGSRFECSECGEKELPLHDRKPKRWKHISLFQYECYLHLRTPRINCGKCGILQWQVPWSRPNSHFTTLFEAFIMRLAVDMPVYRIAELVGEYDTRLWRIIKYHVTEARKQKDYSKVTKLGCDETSSRKGHNYVTIFVDMDKGEVMFATEGKDARTIKRFVDELPKHGANADQIKEATLDMSPAFISGIKEQLPEAEITFDKFHVIQALNKAQDEVRRTEQKKILC